MNRKKTVAVNSMSGMLCMFISVLFSFIIRKVFLEYIGVKFLGITGTFSSVLDTLSLTEIGFQSAIIYNLYKPLHDGDESKINSVINVLKIVYKIIGVLFIIVSFALLPFIKYFLNGIEMTGEIYIYFLLQAWASAATYLLAYKRTLLLADQKDFICKYIDMGMNIVSSLLQIAVIILFHSMTAQLVIKLLTVIISNIFVQVACRRLYPFLHKEKYNREVFSVVWRDAKDVFFGKLAFYIYSSTDNLIISKCLSTVTVGFFTNYTIVTKSLQQFTNSILVPIAPVLGNMMVDSDREKNERVFNIYTHLRFVISMICVVPLLVLMDDFIINVFGRKYLLDDIIVVLLALDLIMQMVHNGCTDYLCSLGYFAQQKYVSIIGAAINIITSIIFVRFFGVSGVLFGTIISQLFFWVCFSYLTHKLCLHSTKRKFFIYWLKNIYYLSAIAATVVICRMIYIKLPVTNFLIKFISGGIICETVVGLIYFVALKPFKEQHELLGMVTQLLHQRKDKPSND